MNTNQTHESRPIPGIAGALAHLCLKSCQKVLAQVSNAKGAIFAEWRDSLKGHERLLRLALNEAEALAWQTAYPHLFFPALAAEKAQAVVDWIQRQQSIRQAAPSFARGEPRPRPWLFSDSD